MTDRSAWKVMAFLPTGHLRESGVGMETDSAHEFWDMKGRGCHIWKRCNVHCL